MEFGNLMSYGPDLDELFRHSTKYVDKIVRGTNPSDLPEEFPTRYALISILRFAKALDLTIQGDRITERIAAPHESLNGMARPRPAPNLLGLRLEALRKAQEHAMPTSLKTPETIATIGIDLGKNTFHLVGMDKRGAIALQRKVSRSQLEHRLSNVPRCLIGMEACSGSHHIGRQLTALGHDVRLIPAQYVKPFLKGHKNDYRDAEAIAEAVQRPTMSFVAIKTPEQMDLLALHRVRSRLVGQRTGTINQIRGFLIELGIIVRQGVIPLRKALPDILSSNTNILSPRMVSLIADLMQDLHRLDERIETVSTEIEALALRDDSCQRLMTFLVSVRSSRVPWWRQLATALASKPDRVRAGSVHLQIHQCQDHLCG